MKIRHIIENDIVEDISLYKNIYKEFINFVREEIKEDYEPSFSFDQFCARMINNFEGVDEDLQDYLDDPDEHLTTRLLRSILKVAQDEFKSDQDSIDKINNVMKNEEI